MYLMLHKVGSLGVSSKRKVFNYKYLSKSTFGADGSTTPTKGNKDLNTVYHRPTGQTVMKNA